MPFLRPIDSAGDANDSSFAGCPIRNPTAHSSLAAPRRRFAALRVLLRQLAPQASPQHPYLLGRPIPIRPSPHCSWSFVGKPQNVRSHAYMASCFGPPTTGEWVQKPTIHHITCMRSLRFSLSSHRQNCSNHTMRLEKCLKNSSLDNWRVRNSIGAKL